MVMQSLRAEDFSASLGLSRLAVPALHTPRQSQDRSWPAGRLPEVEQLAGAKPRHARGRFLDPSFPACVPLPLMAIGRCALMTADEARARAAHYRQLAQEADDQIREALLM